MLEVADELVWAELSARVPLEPHLGEWLSPLRRVVQPSFEQIVGELPVTVRYARRAPVFAPILPLALERLAARLEPVVVPAGAEVVCQGDPGDCVYLIAEGGFEVETRGQPVSHLGPGGLFGEMALLRNAPRNATVRAVEESRIYRLEQGEFVAAVTGHPASSRHVSELVTTRLEELRRVQGEL